MNTSSFTEEKILMDTSRCTPYPQMERPLPKNGKMSSIRNKMHGTTSLGSIRIRSRLLMRDPVTMATSKPLILEPLITRDQRSPQILSTTKIHYSPSCLMRLHTIPTKVVATLRCPILRYRSREGRQRFRARPQPVFPRSETVNTS